MRLGYYLQIPKEEHMKNNVIVTAALVAILFGAGGFVGGMKYSQSKRGNFMMQFGDGTGARVRFGRQNGAPVRGGFRPVTGEILSTDDTSITVKLPDGSSKIIFLSGSTTINKASAGTQADLKTGERVSVFGTENNDGSITAQNIQLGVMFGGRMMQDGTPSGAPSAQ